MGPDYLLDIKSFMDWKDKPMRSTFLSVVFLSLGGTALAEPVKGMWVTEPDRKGQVAHVEVYDCGASAVCGKIVRTFNETGTEIVTENVG